MKQKIEKEIRFVMTKEMYQAVKKKVMDNLSILKHGCAVKELTVMYDNPNPNYSFYSPQIDGRLRLRSSSPCASDFIEENKALNVPSSLLTWKQRIPGYDGTICKEKEVEVSLASGIDTENLTVMLEDILHCPRISSYERVRETFYSEGIEIAFDTFPYGNVVELEIKEDLIEETKLYDMARLLGLEDSAVVSTLSCDDIYKVMCDIAGVVAKSDLLFDDKEMPTFDEYLSHIKKDGGVINETCKNCNSSGSQL